MLRIFYLLANYRRAYYDIRRFREEQGKVRFDIEFVGMCNGSSFEYSVVKECIMNTAVEMGLRPSANEDWPPGQFMVKRTECDNLDCHRHTIEQEDGICSALGFDCKDCEHTVLENMPEKPQLEMWIYCEMQLLQEVLENGKQASSYDYIGCSKGSCWLCHHALINMTKDFKMRQPHLKVCATWVPPPFEHSPQNRARFKEVLRALDGEMRKLVKPTNNAVKHFAQPNCPDATDHFYSPRTRAVTMGRVNFVTD